MRRARPIFWLVSILAWIVKGMLLAIALAALVVWPWSLRHQGMTEEFRWTPRPDRVELVRFAIGWADGRIGFCERRFDFTGESVGRGRAGIAREGAGWQWRVIRISPWVVPEASVPAWGPIRWGHADYENAGYSFVLHQFTVPCWLLVLSAAAWPLTSIGLMIRRRIRRRRSAREGLCRVCGYDLRASPERCPECGTGMESKS